MSAGASRVKRAIRAHWFILAAIAITTGDLSLAMLDSWSDPRLLEIGILFDLSVVIPALYLWCYRSRGKAAILRAIALSFFGIWVAGHIVPDEHHHVLSTVGFVRYIGMAVLVVIEIKLIAMIYRAAFRRDSDSAAILNTAKDAGMPEWAARLMAWEASLWRRAWDALRRLAARS